MTRVQAASAVLRIAGDRTAAVPVLLDALRPLRSGVVDDASSAALRILGEFGGPDAAPAAPCLQAILTSPHRYAKPTHNVLTPPLDATLQQAARTALESIERPPSRT